MAVPQSSYFSGKLISYAVKVTKNFGRFFSL